MEDGFYPLRVSHLQIADRQNNVRGVLAVVEDELTLTEYDRNGAKVDAIRFKELARWCKRHREAEDKGEGPLESKD